MDSEMPGGSSERLAINNQHQSQVNQKKESKHGRNRERWEGGKKEGRSLKKSSAGHTSCSLQLSAEYLAKLGVGGVG